MNYIELLAPAKNTEIGKSAIHCGADAVYIGASAYSAREKASNTIADIEQLTQYAHKYWCKVYVTLNTLLHDHEIPKAVKLIHELADAGIDGLIIQDMGLLECDLPPLPLIASTQTHNVDLDKIRFLESVGFQRIILARELSLNQIKEIRTQTTIELESFVHGSLCVCYSGQCYLSQAIGGRSANRGQCAQPCRKSYALVNEKSESVHPDKHFLSIRDLNQSAHIETMLNAGITSFKIEGRLKEKPYVMNVVGHYRQLLDSILEGRPEHKASSGASIFDFQPAVDKSFNRGFTDYFLIKSKNKVGAIDTPKSIGEYLGHVIEVSAKGIRINTDKEIRPGDGFCYMNENHKLTGMQVNHLQNDWLRFDKSRSLNVGQEIYRNLDHTFIRQLENSQTQRSIDVQFTFSETGSGWQLEALDEDGVSIIHNVEAKKDTAKNVDKMIETVKRQLSKTGESQFDCSNVMLNGHISSFLPVSALNQMRRDALMKLSEKREAERPRGQKMEAKSAADYPEKHLSYLGNVLNEKAIQFYQKYGVQSIEPATENGIDMTGKKVMTTKYCLLYELGKCRMRTSDSYADPLFLLNDKGDKLRLEFDCSQCEMKIYFIESGSQSTRPE